MELTLKYPFVTPAGETINKLTMRRLKVRDIKAITQQSGGKVAEMELIGIARMTSLIPEDLEEMDAADYQVLKDRFLDILGFGGNDLGRSGAAGDVVPVSAE
ncbi:hypothetical protein HNQ59_000681 [Chitinivorax tropicus]|uniref:Phage tail assembly protein n=1 Tax=Chitinivorax tropicus TaxID=714531 RepID=A0A840MKN4_9PROT|nr:phage tail assembly protein [Chitinivorax tropicus]MBB5017417.1 hypothetical protein [Chitinivorax tropicus]